MPGWDDGVFFENMHVQYFGHGVQISCDSSSGMPSCGRSSFFLRPWTQECHVQWTQQTWTQNNKIVCFYANLPRPICCANQSRCVLGRDISASTDAGKKGSVLGPLLYVLFISPVANVINSDQSNQNNTVSFHQYADDTQLYIGTARQRWLLWSDFSDCFKWILHSESLWLAFE